MGGCMQNQKLAESAEEKNKTYPEMMQDLGAHFFKNRKGFKSAVGQVLEFLEEHEAKRLRGISRDQDIETLGDFEDRFEEICGAKDKEQKREIVRLMLRRL